MLDFLRDQVQRAWDWLETTVSDVTDEQANWWPPGTANSIGAGYLHTVINPDVEINRLLFGRVPIIERDWGGDVGQGTRYDPDRFDQWTRGVHVQWDRLHSYGRAVHSWLVGSLSELTEADLARPVDMSRAGLGMWRGLDLYVLHGFSHIYQHGGEIACLKGLQGASRADRRRRRMSAASTGESSVARDGCRSKQASRRDRVAGRCAAS